MAGKTYTAQEMREMADLREAWGDKDEVNDMLRYAAEVVEENAQLKARLEAAVKIASDNSWSEDSGIVDADICANLHNGIMSDILRAARGEGGAE